MSIVLSVKNLTHTYNNNTPFAHNALSNVSFTVNSGEIVGIIGHTGSGKTTLVSHLNGLLKPTSGDIIIDGKNIWDDPKHIKEIRSLVGLVFQYPEYQLFEETVYKDIAFGPKNLGLKGEELHKRIVETCKTVDIDEKFFDKSPFELSGGEKRRVAIAGIMAMRPKVLVLDEPVAGLDPKGRNDVIKMIEEYRNTYNATVLIVSHNMENMSVLADKLLVMNGGKVSMFDTTENVFKRGEELRKIGLDTPIITKVFDRIREKGYIVPDNIFTVYDAVKYLSSVKVQGGETDV